MLKQSVDVEMYTPYLGKDELLNSVELVEIPGKLTEELMKLRLKTVRLKTVEGISLFFFIHY